MLILCILARLLYRRIEDATATPRLQSLNKPHNQRTAAQQIPNGHIRDGVDRDSDLIEKKDLLQSPPDGRDEMQPMDMKLVDETLEKFLSEPSDRYDRGPMSEMDIFSDRDLKSPTSYEQGSVPPDYDHEFTGSLRLAYSEDNYEKGLQGSNPRLPQSRGNSSAASSTRKDVLEGMRNKRSSMEKLQFEDFDMMSQKGSSTRRSSQSTAEPLSPPTEVQQHFLSSKLNNNQEGDQGTQPNETDVDGVFTNNSTPNDSLQGSGNSVDFAKPRGRPRTSPRSTPGTSRGSGGRPHRSGSQLSDSSQLSDGAKTRFGMSSLEKMGKKDITKEPNFVHGKNVFPNTITGVPHLPRPSRRKGEHLVPSSPGVLSPQPNNPAWGLPLAQPNQAPYNRPAPEPPVPGSNPHVDPYNPNAVNAGPPVVMKMAPPTDDAAVAARAARRERARLRAEQRSKERLVVKGPGGSVPYDPSQEAPNQATQAERSALPDPEKSGRDEASITPPGSDQPWPEPPQSLDDFPAPDQPKENDIANNQQQATFYLGNSPTNQNPRQPAPYAGMGLDAEVPPEPEPRTRQLEDPRQFPIPRERERSRPSRRDDRGYISGESSRRSSSSSRDPTGRYVDRGPRRSSQTRGPPRPRTSSQDPQLSGDSREGSKMSVRFSDDLDSDDNPSVRKPNKKSKRSKRNSGDSQSSQREGAGRRERRRSSRTRPEVQMDPFA